MSTQRIVTSGEEQLCICLWFDVDVSFCCVFDPAMLKAVPNADANLGHEERTRFYLLSG